MSELCGGIRYDPIAVSAESTVVAEYFPDAAEETAYQSEAALEQEFIRLLQSQAYEYLPLTSEAELIANLRTQLEALNGITFTDGEGFDRLASTSSPTEWSPPRREAVAAWIDERRWLTR